MALLVWLPLNGDLRNLGLADILMVSMGTTTYADGKIGKCIQFNHTLASGIYDANKCATLKFTDNFSYCLWLNNQFDSSDSGAAHYVFTVARADGTTYGYGMLCNGTYASVRFGSLYWNVSIPLNTWNHIALTKSGNIISVYLNGSLYSTNTFTGTLPTYTNYNGLGLGHFRYNGGNIYPSRCLVNDFRIYDHCLSPKEVKEISKGLVLHYKLDQPLSENVEIPLSIVSHDSTRTGSEDVTKAFDNSTSTKWYEAAKHTTNIIVETISNLPANKLALYPGNDNHLYNARNLGQFDIYGSNDNINYNLLYSCNDTYYGTVPSIWYYYNFYNDINYKYYKFVTIGRSSGIQIGEIKLFFEQLTSYDYSGYKHDGIIQGTATTDNNNGTSRYNRCINLVNSSISCPLFQFPEVTISFWINRNSLTNSRQFIYTGWYGISIEFTAGNGWLIYYTIDNKATTKRCSPTTILLPNQWYHIAFIIGVNGVKSYVNGVCEKTETYTAPYYGTTSAYIGQYSTIRNFNAKLSDFRIYSTALSEEDIKELCNTSAIVDNLGNIYGYLFEEELSNNITRTGIVNSNLFVEKIDYLYLPLGSSVNTELYYEVGDTCLAVTTVRYDSGGSGRDLMGFSGTSNGYWGVTAAGAWEPHGTFSYTNSDITQINTISYLYTSSKDIGYYRVGSLVNATSYSVRNKYIYNVKLYKNGVLERDLIPFKEGTQYGLYDLVNKHFYACNTGGTLSIDKAKETKMFNDHLEANQLIEI